MLSSKLALSKFISFRSSAQQAAKMNQFCSQPTRNFAKAVSKAEKSSKSSGVKSQPTTSNGVYLWSKLPRLGSKSGSVTTNLQMPKGTPQRIEEFDALNVQRLRVGMRHSAVISDEGQLYTFGQGNWGVLGHGNEYNVNFKKPKHVEGLSKHKVVDVAMGEYHTIALTDDGNVWTWGYGGKKGFFNWMYTQEIGALGHGDVEPTFTPKKVSFFQENNLKVTSIAAGNYHCVVLCDDGNLYNWGVGLYGVLGNGSNNYALTPQINEDFVYQREELEKEGLEFGFRKISAADDYTAAVMGDGQMLVWGKNDFGQLGVGSGIGIDLVESENIPREVELDAAMSSEEQKDPVNVIDVSTGSRTMMALDAKQRLFQTGLKIDWSPKHVKLNQERIEGKIEQLACGHNHYAFYDTGNNLHCFGNVVKQKSEEQYDGYGIFDGYEIFDGNTIVDLQMKYQTFGVLVQDK